MSRPALASLCIAALAVLAPLPADATRKTPLEAAREQLNEASFEKAIAIADAALKGTLPDADRAAFHLLRAEAYSALQKQGPMRDALEAALKADSAAAYDEGTKPELLEALATARRKYAGKISVAAPPKGTSAPEVFLDGESVGRAPVEATVAIGRHQVSLIWSASSRADQSVLVRTEQTTAVPVPAINDLAKPAVADVLKPMPPPEPLPKPAGTFRWPLIPLVAGGAVAAAGGVCLIVSGANYAELTGGDGVSTLQLTRAEAQLMADQNQAAQGVGIAFVSVGLAAAAFGGIFFGFGLDQPKVAFAPTPHGGALVLSGTLP